MRREERNQKRLTVALAIALLLHLLLGYLGQQFFVPKPPEPQAKSITIDLGTPEPEPPPPEEVPEEYRPPEAGQIVELPKPDVEEIPEESKYLSEYNQSVPEEMKSEKFKINPEVVAPVYSEEAQTSKDDIRDVQMEEDSTGATAGQEPMPESDFALFPERFSQWAFTNKVGQENPMKATSDARQRMGAPQNDYLNEKTGPATLLNSREFLYADYFNKIRRLVNFWWSQNLDNISPREIGQPLRRPAYKTSVIPTLDAKGNLVGVRLIKGSGVRAFDKAVMDAWKSASPFPEPPDGLVHNGQAELINFVFILEMGRGESQYNAIDPRANVRFPGIAWPR